MQKKRESLLLSLLMNIVAPALVLGKGTKFFPDVSPVACLVIALAFPVVYFVIDFIRRREANIISILGFAGTLLTGGIGLMKLSPFWVAVKDASIPALIAVALLVSRKLGNKILFNERVFNVPTIEAACKERGTTDALARTLRLSSLVLVASFALSAILNFFLARYIVVTDPAENLDAFNEELAKMFAIAWPVIVVPCMIFCVVALFLLIRGIKNASGLETDALLNAENK